FFFQAVDGIRDRNVTGVQTCALPISRSDRNVPDVLVGLGWPSVFAVLSQAHTDAGTPVIEGMLDLVHLDHQITVEAELPDTITRSEERRVGKGRRRREGWFG